MNNKIKITTFFDTFKKIPVSSIFLFIRSTFLYYFSEIILILLLAFLLYLQFFTPLNDYLWSGMEKQQQYLKNLLSSDVKFNSSQASPTKKLFNQAVNCHLIQFDPKTFILSIAPKQDIILLKNNRISRPSYQCKQPEIVIDALYHTRYGDKIRKDIKRWNQFHYYTAVRDNRLMPKLNKSSAVLFLSRGEHPNQWQAYQKIKSISIPSSSNDKDLALNYGFLGYNLSRHFNDWQVATPPDNPNIQLQFLSTLPAQAVPIIIQIVGDIQNIELNGVDKTAELSILQLCSHKKLPPTCDKNEPTQASQIIIPTLAHQTKISITVRPINNLTRDLSQRLKAYQYESQPSEKEQSYKMDEINIALKYSPKDQATYHLEWQDKAPYVKRLETASIDFKIISADKVVLFAKEEQQSPEQQMPKITKEGLNLGLAPIVGIDKQDYQSLAGYLFQQDLNKKAEFSLTIRADYQKIALKHLMAQAKIMQKKDKNKYNRQRRGAVILLDGGPCTSKQVLSGQNCIDQQTGHILTAATIPMVKAGANIWDIKAIGAWNPFLSPLSTHAWSQGNVHYNPGSTFKPITALSAIQLALNGNQDIAQAIAGLSPSQLPKIMGLKPTDFELVIPHWEGKRALPDFVVHNYKNHTISRSFKTARYSGCPNARKKNISDQLGLCESIMTSMNIYFMKMALLIDQDKLLSPVHKGEMVGFPKDLQFQKTLHHIFPEKRLDLSQDLKFNKPHSGRLNMELINASVEKNTTQHQLNLIQNSIGQAVQVTPLHMAMLYNSISNGQVILPKLFPSSNSESHPALLEGHWQEGVQLKSVNDNHPLIYVGLNNLHAGLHAVVNGRNINRSKNKIRSGGYGGTASGSFLRHARKLMKHAYGKTGTAATQKDLLSLWFTGWIDPIPELGFKRRIIFTCMLTHGRSGKDTGGGTCAPVIAKILTDIMHQNKLKQEQQ